ncbi:MAG: hypothetical protein JWM02_2770 [Frankiales bacterium]|nr:hypothetical protein [Frankiales bacterium]
MRTIRTAAVLCGAATTVLLVAGPASAHVTVHSTDATSGGLDTQITFRVPNEEAKASTTKVEIVLPADKPFAGALAASKAGWKVVTTSHTLKTPITTDDGKITTAVSTVTWTATAGGTGPGMYDDFDIAVGQLPVTDSLTFKAIQTYNDGNVVRWIQQSAPGATSHPDFPAPVLVLRAATAAVPSATPSSVPSVTAKAVPVASTQASNDSTAKALGGAGLGVGAVALLLALAALLRSRASNAR